jgi:hypothetical protein
MEAAAGDAMFYQREFFGSSYRNFIGVASKLIMGMGLGNVVVFDPIYKGFKSDGIGDYPIEFFRFYGNKQLMMVDVLLYGFPKFLIVIGVFVGNVAIEVIFDSDYAIGVRSDIVL